MANDTFDALEEYRQEAGFYVNKQQQAFDGIAALASMDKFDFQALEVLTATTLARYEIVNCVKLRDQKAQGSWASLCVYCWTESCACAAQLSLYENCVRFHVTPGCCCKKEEQQVQEGGE